MSDDDWETDADFENNMTEAEQRAYGNRETMEKYQAVMEKAAGGAIPGQSKLGVTPAKELGTNPSAPNPSAAAPLVDVSDHALPPAARAVPDEVAAHAYVPKPSGPPPPAPTPPQPAAPARAAVATPGRLNIPAMCGGSDSASNKTPPPSGAALGTMGSSGSLLSGGGTGASARGNVHSRHRRISDSGTKQLQELFASFDLNKNGRIEVRELLLALERLGLPANAEKVAALLKEGDKDKSGDIDFNE